MSIFASSEQLYGVAEELFARLAAENPQTAAQLLRARMLIRIVCSHPSTEIWVQARRPPLHTQFGHQRLNPDLEIRMDAGTLHEILSGRVTLAAALARQKLQVKGQVWKAKALAELFERSQSIYPQVLEAQGILASGADH
jgi:hypothetical protein